MSVSEPVSVQDAERVVPRPPSDSRVPDGFWQREISHIPQPLTASADSVIVPAANRGFAAMLDEMCVLLEAFEFRTIQGWGYVRAVPFGGKQKKAPPAWLMPLLVRAVPPLRRRVRRCVEVVRADTFYGYIDTYEREWKPELIRRARELRESRWSELDDMEVEQRVREAEALVYQGLYVHCMLHGTNALVMADLVFTCRDLLGWDEATALELMTGLSGTSTAPARKLAELAEIARRDAELRARLEAPEPPDLDVLADASPAFAGALAEYQEEFGQRSIRYEIADVTLAEVPQLTLALVRDQLAKPYDAVADDASSARTRERRREEARRLLSHRDEGDRQRFERALQRAERFYPVREDKEFYDLSQPFAVMRYTLLEVGRRLAERGRLRAVDDVFHLTLEEALEALEGGGRDVQSTVDGRRAEHARVKQHPGPPVHGRDPGPPPSFAALPPEARFANEAMVWLLDRIFAPIESVRQQAPGSTVRGTGASAGAYTGPARVVMSEDELDRIRPGDVLVCPITSPVWSVVFPRLGALVADSGGILSHPAIIAREYRIPAVVGTGNSTSLIRDGQLVSVDGDRGEVSLT